MTAFGTTTRWGDEERAARAVLFPGPDEAHDPVGWADRRLGRFLWSRQREVAEAVRDHRRVAVKSCHTAGKSYVAATIAAWWLDAHAPGTAFVVTSAPTGAQVKAILWREIGRAHRTGRLEGHVNLTEWYARGEIIAFGRKPNDYEPDAFQGVHAMYVLVILDEACGIPEGLWDAADTLASNEHSRVLAIGNPDDPQSHFATVCSRPTWHTIRISAFDTPNFTGEEVPSELRLLLVSRQWVEDKKQDWTEASPLYVSKVLGEFPTDAEDGVVPASWAARCRWNELEATGRRELGIDIAEGGGDKTVAWLRQGPVALQKWVVDEREPGVLARRLLEVIVESGAVCLKIDATGSGWGVAGTLHVWAEEGRHRCEVVRVKGAEQADEPDQYLNLRAETWWRARDACRLKTWDLTRCDDDTIAELVAPKWHMQNPKSRIQVEKKDEVRKRLGRSPDSADALLLAFTDRSSAVEAFATADMRL